MKLVGIVAKKVGMTRVLDKEGNLIAVTLLHVPNQKITKVLTKAKEGYDAIQVGFAEKAEKNMAKADIARLRKSNVNDNLSRFTEFRCDEKAAQTFALGSALDVNLLDGIEFIDATGLTKGRGFTGSVKRWNTACGRMTHGSRFHRRPGSLGTRTTPGRVFKGKPVHGHYGDERVTIQNLKVVDVNAAESTIAVRGSVPGHRDGVLLIKPTVK